MGSNSTKVDAAEDGHHRPRGVVQNEIADAVVSLAKKHLGRGPESTRVTIDGDLVVVLLRNSLGSSERLLVGEGEGDAVLAFRRVIQDVLRPALVAEIQRIMGRQVGTFMSANALDPDYAAEIFILL